MTGRERVTAALEHRETDSVPVDFGGTLSSGIHIEAYSQLLRKIKSRTTARIIDLFQFLAWPDEEVAVYFKSDVRMLCRLYPRFQIPVDRFRPYVTERGTYCLAPEGFCPIRNATGDLILRDEKGIFAKMPKGGLYFEICRHEHGYYESEADLTEIEFAHFSKDELAYLKIQAERLYRDTPYAIVGAFGGSILETCQRSLGYEKCMMDMLLSPAAMQAYIEKLTQAHMENLEVYLDAVGQYIQVIQFSDDLDSQNSLLLSSELYRRLIKPYHSQMYKYVKKRCPHVKVLLHSCGAIYPLLGDLIDAGVDAVNPVQISAYGMQPKHLKREYGAQLTFWGGGADMQALQSLGSLEAIRAHVQRNTEIFSQGGGFVFAPVHNIQADVTPEQIMAIYQAVNGENAACAAER